MALDKRTTLSLQPSEAIVIRAAADIYAAYIIAGKVQDGQEKEWRDRAIREAFEARAARHRSKTASQRPPQTVL